MGEGGRAIKTNDVGGRGFSLRGGGEGLRITLPQPTNQQE